MPHSAKNRRSRVVGHIQCVFYLPNNNNCYDNIFFFFFFYFLLTIPDIFSRLCITTKPPGTPQGLCPWTQPLGNLPPPPGQTPNPPMQQKKYSFIRMILMKIIIHNYPVQFPFVLLHDIAFILIALQES